MSGTTTMNAEYKATIAELRRLDLEWAEIRAASNALRRRSEDVEACYPRDRRIGDRVRVARTNRDLSQKMLARIAGLHPSTISSIECGNGVSTGSLIQLSDALDVSLDWLIKD